MAILAFTLFILIEKKLRFAVNELGWLTTFDDYLIGITEMPCIKNFIIAKENENINIK